MKDYEEIDATVLYAGTTRYRSMKPNEKKRYHKYMKHLEDRMAVLISRCVGQENRCGKREVMHELFHKIPTNPKQYDEYSAIIKKIFRKLKARGFPFINCRGSGGRGDWGYCIPNDLAFLTMDKFLNNIHKGIGNEITRTEDSYKIANKEVKKVVRDKQGKVINIKKKEK